MSEITLADIEAWADDYMAQGQEPIPEGRKEVPVECQVCGAEIEFSTFFGFGNKSSNFTYYFYCPDCDYSMRCPWETHDIEGWAEERKRRGWAS